MAVLCFFYALRGLCILLQPLDFVLFLCYNNVGDIMRNVIITGGTRGIGKAITEAFLENGDRVFAVFEKNSECAAECEKLGAITICADISKTEGVQRVFDIVHKYGKADILINNAGIAQIKPFADITEADWDRMFDVNIKSAFLMSRAVLSDMLLEKYGKIINVSSVWGQTGGSCEVHYSASKAAMVGFTKALAKELGLSGICVNCIAPGVIATDMNKMLDDDTVSELTEEIPLNRIGTPEDIANTALFLASDKADYITGQVIAVNGGMYI